MRILSIAAPCNSSGKTLLACRILQAHPGAFGAVKISTIYADGNCPRDSRSKVCACTQLHHDDYRVIADPAVLGQPDTDTGDLLAAGGSPVFWGLARPGAHERLWQHLEQHFLLPGRPLLTEGSQIARFLEGERRLIFVVNPETPRKRWKTDSERFLEQADLVLVNPYRDGFRGETDEARALLDALGPRGLLFDLSRPATAWPAPLSGLVTQVAGQEGIASF